jgi:hypothetical protein
MASPAIRQYSFRKLSLGIDCGTNIVLASSTGFGKGEDLRGGNEGKEFGQADVELINKFALRLETFTTFMASWKEP